METLLKKAMSAPRGSQAQNEAISLIAEKFAELEQRVEVFEKLADGE